MEYKTPKVLEKKPIVMGFDLKMIIVIVFSSMLFLFTVFTNFLIAIIFPILAIGFITINKKYPAEGELITMLKYQSGTKCIQFNQTIGDVLYKRVSKKDINESHKKESK